MLGAGKRSAPLRKDVTDRGTKTNFLQDVCDIKKP